MLLGDKIIPQHLKDMLCDKECSAEMTGYQHTAMDAVIELLEYCNYDRLCELAKADHDKRCFISDIKLGDEVFFIEKYNGKPLGGVSKGHVQAIAFTRAGTRIKIREYHNHNKDFPLDKTVFRDYNAAKKALEEMES